MRLLFRFYALVAGQRFVCELPVALELVHSDDWIATRFYVRQQLERECHSFGVVMPPDPVVLCFLEGADMPPFVWKPWDGITDLDPIPSWADSTNARLHVVERLDAAMAIASWPQPSWVHAWDPARKLRDLAKQRGVCGLLVGGPQHGARFQMPNPPLPTIHVPTANHNAYSFDTEIYERDPEPLEYDPAPDQVLWAYRYKEPKPPLDPQARAQALADELLRSGGHSSQRFWPITDEFGGIDHSRLWPITDELWLWFHSSRST